MDVIQVRKELFDSVKNSFEQRLNNTQDVDLDALTKSFIKTFLEEDGLYSIIGTIPIMINDKNKNFLIFIDIRQNGNVLIKDIIREE